jgi:2-C-methyl-D-erythritol 4-phosphate cytidylyltransferase
MGRFAVILPAAGRSSRFGDPKQKKVYAEVDGRAVWLRAVGPFLKRDDVAQIIVAIAPEDRELFDRRFRHNVAFLNIDVIDGGAERHDTVALALGRLADDVEFVAIHDAARPCLSDTLIDDVFTAARRLGAALPGVPVSDTLKRVADDGTIVETVSRAGLRAVQTPQAFRRDWLVAAYARRDLLNATITDDAQLVEALGHTCHVVPGSPENLKITTVEDLRLAEAVLRARPEPKGEAVAHPFADDQSKWADVPKVRPEDLFG